jgi:hypothetical protein
MTAPRLTADLLARTARVSTSLADLLRRLDRPLVAGHAGYVRRRLAHYGIDTSHFADEPLPPRARRSFSRARLEAAAARATSVREVIEHLGYPPEDSPYGHVRKKLDQFGIDTRHFTRGHGRGPAVLAREPLSAAVSAATSTAGVLRLLGLADTGSGRALVRRSIAHHALTTDHFTGQAHFRGTVSPRRRSAEQILRRDGGPGTRRTGTPQLRRALDDVGVPHRCGECGTGEIWQGRRLVLEIDHINGDRWDNRRENLRYLCPSCHSQTRTFANRRRPPEAPGSAVQ